MYKRQKQAVRVARDHIANSDINKDDADPSDSIIVLSLNVRAAHNSDSSH